jgi:hypothetical protein
VKKRNGSIRGIDPRESKDSEVVSEYSFSKKKKKVYLLKFLEIFILVPSARDEFSNCSKR